MRAKLETNMILCSVRRGKVIRCCLMPWGKCFRLERGYKVKLD